MKVTFYTEGLCRTQWHEIALRFVFGGLVTVAAGLIAKRFGPSVGGLFLAFPAVFPASATLVAKHAKEEKEQVRLTGARRAAGVAALDSRGTAMGAVGLIVFAVVAWKLLPGHKTALVLIGSTVAWFAVAATLWWLRKVIRTSQWARSRRHRTA
jgi:Protein of unknown function (DUF3147)